MLIIAMLYGPTVFLIKLSIFLLYLHIFAVSRRTRLLVYCGIVIVLVGNAIPTAIFGAACIPRVGEYWSQSFTSRRCHEESLETGLAAALINAITDYYVLWIPLPIVWKLNLPLRKKIGLVIIFMQGLLYDTQFF